MLGHCAGLRNTQQLGDLRAAHGYVREDHVLDEELPLWVPVPALAEVQLALEQAVAEVTQLQRLRAEEDPAHRHRRQHHNRNWELLPKRNMPSTPERRFGQSRAVALNGKRHRRQRLRFPRAPYGTLLSSATSRCTARSSCRAWPTPSTASAWTSTCASACAPSSCCARNAPASCTAASCAALPRWRSVGSTPAANTGRYHRCFTASEARHGHT